MRVFTKEILFFVLFCVAVFLAIVCFSYTAKKCGLGKALLMGESGMLVAAAGLCEK